MPANGPLDKVQTLIHLAIEQLLNLLPKIGPVAQRQTVECVASDVEQQHLLSLIQTGDLIKYTVYDRTPRRS